MSMNVCRLYTLVVW